MSGDPRKNEAENSASLEPSEFKSHKYDRERNEHVNSTHFLTSDETFDNATRSVASLALFFRSQIIPKTQ